MNPNKNEQWFRKRMKGAMQFIRLLRIDPYIFLVYFQLAIRETPSRQMMEDKICMHWYNTTAQYCYDMPSSDEEGVDDGQFKSRILIDSALFGTYNTFITTIPAIIWALIAGPWIDRYMGARKLLLLMGCCAGILENIIYICISIGWKSSVYFALLDQIPQIFLGGFTTRIIALNHFIASTTPPKLMVIRFMWLDIVADTAYTVGSSLGGYLLVQNPMFDTGELRNYTICFIIALTAEVLAFLSVVLIINEKIARKQQMDIENKLREIKGMDSEEGPDQKSEMNGENKDIHPIRLLFDWRNIKSMVITVLKKRPNKVRKQINLLLLCVIIYCLFLAGGEVVSAQFTQEVYHWSPDWFSYVNSMSRVIGTALSITIIPFLKHVLNVPDIPLAMLGFISLFFTDLLIGSWISGVATYVSLFVLGIGGVAYMAIKSHMTKIVDRDEMGKIISFMTSLDTLAPMIINPILVIIFKYTIDTYPGCVYHVIAALMLIPICIMMWIDLYTPKPLIDGYDN